MDNTSDGAETPTTAKRHRVRAAVIAAAIAAAVGAVAAFGAGSMPAGATSSGEPPATTAAPVAFAITGDPAADAKPQQVRDGDVVATLERNADGSCNAGKSPVGAASVMQPGDSVSFDLTVDESCRVVISNISGAPVKPDDGSGHDKGGSQDGGSATAGGQK
jgi:hypothetical protein